MAAFQSRIGIAHFFQYLLEHQIQYFHHLIVVWERVPGFGNFQ